MAGRICLVQGGESRVTREHRVEFLCDESPISPEIFRHSKTYSKTYFKNYFRNKLIRMDELMVNRIMS